LEHNDRFRLLEHILFYLYRELRQTDDSWRERLSERLYMKGKQARFIVGGTGSNEVVEGIVRGIGEDGFLLIARNQSRGKTGEVEAFSTGELDVYPRG
jgi:biotin-(acetyl-CoA carboxylase) ligase